MNPNKKVLVILLIFVLAMAVIACSCTSLIPNLPNITNPLTGQDEPEPMPGLTGTWVDPETTDNFTIVWRDGAYVVTDVSWEGNSYSISSQNWDGSTLTWSYYDTDLNLTVTYETTSLSGDSLYVNWSYSDGSGGDEILSRK